MDLGAELIKLGVAGLIAVILWIMLLESEKREALKDQRIQLLENKLTESYDERIAAADRIANALHSNSRAMEILTTEVKASK